MLSSLYSSFRAWTDEVLEEDRYGILVYGLVLLHLWLAKVVLSLSWDPASGSLIDTALMPIHEGGHTLFAFFGTFLAVLGGSLLQWLVPLFLVVGFVRQRDLYAICAGIVVFGVSLNSTYVYMDSAFHLEKYPDMVFVTLGDAQQEATHDWQYLFGSLGMYHSSDAVVALMRVLSLGMLWCGWLAGAWVLGQCIVRRWMPAQA